jgi:RHS repeat-associated protein
VAGGLRGIQYHYGYNLAGRITAKGMYVSGTGVLIEAGYTYDNEGRVTAMTHPDGNSYTYGFDAMGRTNGMTLGAAPVVTAGYGLAGQLTSITYDGVSETRSYNALLQMTRLIAVSGLNPVVDLEYRFSGTQNNGRVTSVKDWVSGEEVTYQYDALQRLSHAETVGPQWGLTFSYDGFGNLMDRVVTKGSGPGGPVGVDPGTNRLIGGQYDANGNFMSVAAGGYYGYDVENRLTVDNGSGGVQYGYDPANRRVYRWQDQVSEEVYFSGIEGKRLATYQIDSAGLSLQGTNLYFGGKMIRSQGQTVVLDRLGSVRWRSTGERFNYFPYGEEYVATGNGREKFGTYIRDSNVMDYADQRYYGVGSGRFLTPDPYRASGGPADPGSWNRYAHTRGDPINRYDPHGLEDEEPPQEPAMKVCSDGSIRFIGDPCPDELPDAPPSPAQNTIGEVNKRAIGGYDKALNALANQDCWGAIGAQSAASATARLETTQIRTDYLGRTAVLDSGNIRFTTAETRGDGRIYLNVSGGEFFTPFNVSAIRLSDGSTVNVNLIERHEEWLHLKPGSLNDTDLYQAAYLIHEVAHILNGFADDTGDLVKSLENTGKILHSCFGL